MSSAAPINIEEYEKIQPVARLQTAGGEVIFAVPNMHTLWRVNTLFQKEPDTLAWIQEFQPGEVMVDIGANVGMYSIWAGKTRGAKVFAFEPESQNFALLNKNIFINQIGDKVIAYSAALSNTEGFSQLNISQFVGGGSCHTFAEKVDFNLKPFQPIFQQGCYSTTLDRLIEINAIPLPHYIKIDVDGIEHKVIEGCMKTLAKPEVKSVLVELNTNLPVHREIIEKMRGLGYGVSEEQLKIAMRTSGAFAGVGNHIFRRDLL